MGTTTVSRNIPFPGSCIISIDSEMEGKTYVSFPARLEFQIPDPQNEQKIYDNVVNSIDKALCTGHTTKKNQGDSLEITSWLNGNVEIWRYNFKRNNLFLVFLANCIVVNQIETVAKKILESTGFWPDSIYWGSPANTYII